MKTTATTTLALLIATLGYAEIIVMQNPQPSRADVEEIREKRRAIRNATLEEKVDYLLDRAEITDLITTYAYSVDTRDWPLHDSIFTEEIAMGSGESSGKILSAKRVEILDRFFEKFSATQHLGFPLAIHIDGDTAYAVASLHARHFNESGDPATNTLLFGQYEYWLIRTDDGWRISRMALVNRTRHPTSAAMRDPSE